MTQVNDSQTTGQAVRQNTCHESDLDQEKPGNLVPIPPGLEESGKIRVDIWVWAARQYKTRSAAKTAIKAGHVRINGVTAKPSANIKVGDLITVRIAGFDNKLRVLRLFNKRMGYAIAQQCYQDESDPRLPAIPMPMLPRREPGSGRPTKKERRELDRLRGYSSTR